MPKRKALKDESIVAAVSQHSNEQSEILSFKGDQDQQANTNLKDKENVERMIVGKCKTHITENNAGKVSNNSQYFTRRSERLVAKRDKHLRDNENFKPRLLQPKKSTSVKIIKVTGCKSNRENNETKVGNDYSHSTIEKINKVKGKSGIEYLKPAISAETKEKKRILKNDSYDSKKDSNSNKKKIKYETTNKHSQISLKSTQSTQHHLNKSDSFEEYGLILPSYEKILGNIARLKNEAKALDTYEKLYKDLDITLPTELKELVSDNPTPQKLELLDCKHLSIEEIKKYFHNNLDHFSNIFKGKTYSERHDKYKNYDPTFDFTYCTSTVVYTEEQKDYLLMLLQENFDPEEKLTQYFFKVLLPEVCLKIFMDVHGKTGEEAINYLEWIPVE